MSKVRFSRNTKSSRELRRLAEREQTREQRKKAVDAFWALPKEERQQRMADNEMVKRIERNGITMEDVKAAEEKAMQDGYLAGKIETLKLCYAGICLALNELHGFGQKRCKEVLNAVDEKVVYALTSDDEIQAVMDRMGLEISFKDVFPGERITEVEHAG